MEDSTESVEGSLHSQNGPELAPALLRTPHDRPLPFTSIRWVFELPFFTLDLGPELPSSVRPGMGSPFRDRPRTNHFDAHSARVLPQSRMVEIEFISRHSRRPSSLGDASNPARLPAVFVDAEAPPAHRDAQAAPRVSQRSGGGTCRACLWWIDGDPSDAQLQSNLVPAQPTPSNLLRSPPRGVCHRYGY